MKCGCGYGQLDDAAGGNKRTCKTPLEYLIYAMESEIRSVNLPTSSSSSGGLQMPWRPIVGLNQTVGIDFDYRDAKIFFSDVLDSRIAAFQPPTGATGSGSDIYNQPPPPPVIVDILRGRRSSAAAFSFFAPPTISMPEGIAYDWVSDTIYYTDAGLYQIVSYKVATGARYVIGFSQSPRAIVVHPCKGMLFWSDVGSSPMIARTSLAGSSFVRIVTQGIKWPNGLALDFDDERLYWADAFYDRMESADLDGNYRQALAVAMHPFAITVHGHYIYWSDWRTKGIYRAEKYRGSNTVPLVQALPKRPMDLHVWSEQRQKCAFNPCSIANGGCSHICAVAPPGNRTECRCPSGMRLRLTNADRTCSPLYAPRCNATQFTCLNGLCIK